MCCVANPHRDILAACERPDAVSMLRILCIIETNGSDIAPESAFLLSRSPHVTFQRDGRSAAANGPGPLLDRDRKAGGGQRFQETPASSLRCASCALRLLVFVPPGRRPNHESFAKT